MHQTSTGTQPPLALTQVTLQQRDELSVLHINNRHACATIALQGAQLLEYARHGEKPIVWLSDRVEYKRGQGQRGGVPICWPWFGAIDRNPNAVRAHVIGHNAPAHGLVRMRDWTLHSVRESDDSTEIVLQFITDSVLHKTWPYAAQLQLRVAIGKTLTMTLTTTNIDKRPLALTQALHTYFAVSAIDRVHITGFENTRYIDTLDAWREHRQLDAIRFSGETDRIYLDVPPAMQIHDKEWQRTIQLHARNSTSAIVWNPWIEKTKRLSQMTENGWRDMLCIETANVLDDSIAIAPGKEHELSVEISVLNN